MQGWVPLEQYRRLSYPTNALFYVESVKVSPVIVGQAAAGGNTGVAGMISTLTRAHRRFGDTRILDCITPT